jgi:hypothetical protein
MDENTTFNHLLGIPLLEYLGADRERRFGGIYVSLLISPFSGLLAARTDTHLACHPSLFIHSFIICLSSSLIHHGAISQAGTTASAVVLLLAGYCFTDVDGGAEERERDHVGGLRLSELCLLHQLVHMPRSPMERESAMLTRPGAFMAGITNRHSSLHHRSLMFCMLSPTSSPPEKCKSRLVSS